MKKSINCIYCHQQCEKLKGYRCRCNNHKIQIYYELNPSIPSIDEVYFEFPFNLLLALANGMAANVRPAICKAIRLYLEMALLPT